MLREKINENFLHYYYKSKAVITYGKDSDGAGQASLLNINHLVNPSTVTLWLYPLSALTPDQLNEFTGERFVKAFAEQKIKDISTQGFLKFVWEYGGMEFIDVLIHNGFDVFNLIGAGLAKNRMELKAFGLI